MMTKIAVSKNVPQDQWAEFFDQFSDGNRGRHLSIRLMDSEFGDEGLIQNAPLMAILYDRPGKGNDLVIELGKDQVTYAHTIDAPNQVLIGQDANGEITAMQITDAAGTQTLMMIEAD